MPMDNTELSAIIPEVWSQDILEIVYQEAVGMNRLQRVDGDVSAFGDILHLPGMDTVSVNDVTASTGAVADQDITLLDVSLTVDKWKEATIQLVDKATKQANMSILNNFKGAFARALYKQVDADLFGLYSDITTNIVGDGSANFNEDIATIAIGKLLDTQYAEALRDPNRVSFILHSSQWKVVKKQSPWNEAQVTGESIGGTLKMSVPNIYGVPLFFSTVIVNPGGPNPFRANLLTLREAFALGIQSNVEFKELVSTGLARRFNSNILYGVKTRSESRAVLVKTTV